MGGGYRLTHPRDIKVSDLIKPWKAVPHRWNRADLEHPTPGQIALDFVGGKLANAISSAMDSMTLEELVEHVNKSANSAQEMYYI